jgi:L-ascorbate metabolism protein UlaG (beta-lactamase superfamily)
MHARIRRTFICLFLFSGLWIFSALRGAWPDSGTDRITVDSDSLKVLGHASIKIKTAAGMIIYIDPASGTDYADSADVVLITHQHGDHNKLNLIRQKKSCTVIQNAQAFKNGAYQSFVIGDLKVDAVAAYNSNHPKGTGVGYVLEFNGIKVYHAGDTGKIEEMADLTARNITYALLPMDGIYNMGPEVAMEADSVIQPKYCIPIHTSPGGYSAAIVARFTAENKLEVKPGESIALERDATSVLEEPGIPSEFGLGRNYPNPFNPSTTIGFCLAQGGFTTLKIYDLLGREVASLVSENLEAGVHKTVWNAGDAAGGAYLVMLRSGRSVVAGKLLLLR